MKNNYNDYNDNQQEFDFNSYLNGEQTIHNVSTSNDLLIINESSENHKVTKTLFKKKYDQLKVIFKFWSEGDLNSVINALKLMKEKIVMNDFFNCGLIKNDITKLPFSVELILETLIMATKLSQDKYEVYKITAFETCYAVINLYKNKIYPGYLTKLSNGNIDEVEDKRVKQIKEILKELKNYEILQKIKDTREKKYSDELYNIVIKIVQILEEALITI